MNKQGVNRRKFLKKAANAAVGAIGFPYIVSSSALGKTGTVAPSERINLGIIGAGIRGTTHIRTFIHLDTAQIVAVCDLFESRRKAARELIEKHYAQNRKNTYRGCDTYNDFREFLARSDIDAVVIAAPEHWHGLLGIASAKAGKDIYGEKALTLTVAEGQALCKTVRRYKCVFQVGTQQRSYRDFRFACELVRNGYLGRLRKIEVGVPGGHALDNSPTIPVPDGLDYDRWLGPAPNKPYNAIRCTSPEGWYHIYDYCIGWIQSWGVHHLDIALWGAPSLTNSTIEAEGTALFPSEGLGNTSLTWNVDFRTKDGLLVNFTDNTKNKQGCLFKGDKGWVYVNRSGIWSEPKSLLDVTIKPDEKHIYTSGNHHLNFLECIRSRKDPVSSVESGHTSTILSLIADVATRTRRKVTWDWKTESFINDDKANRMLVRSMRSPWHL